MGYNPALKGSVYSAPYKEAARLLVANLAISQIFHKPSLNVLTLPGTVYRLESHLHQEAVRSGIDIQFTFVEDNPKTDIESAMPSELIPHSYVIRGDVDCYLCATSDQFDLVYLDYCGPLTDEHKVVIYKSRRYLRSPGVLAATFSLARVGQPKKGEKAVLGQIREMLPTSEFSRGSMFEYDDARWSPSHKASRMGLFTSVRGFVEPIHRPISVVHRTSCLPASVPPSSFALPLAA